MGSRYKGKGELNNRDAASLVAMISQQNKVANTAAKGRSGARKEETKPRIMSQNVRERLATTSAFIPTHECEMRGEELWIRG